MAEQSPQKLCLLKTVSLIISMRSMIIFKKKKKKKRKKEAKQVVKKVKVVEPNKEIQELI